MCVIAYSKDFLLIVVYININNNSSIRVFFFYSFENTINNRYIRLLLSVGGFSLYTCGFIITLYWAQLTLTQLCCTFLFYSPSPFTFTSMYIAALWGQLVSLYIFVYVEWWNYWPKRASLVINQAYSLSINYVIVLFFPSLSPPFFLYMLDSYDR